MSDTDTSNKRPLDIIVWGASGFTGRLVVEYLATRYPPGESLRWAIGGRNREKLERALDDIHFPAERPEIIVADGLDIASMRDMAGRTRVVITTVGPYAKYGSPLVQACAESGTDYCDLAGETQWIRRMIDEHEETARKTGARILMSCAFDSVPSDIGVHVINREAVRIHGKPCRSVRMLVRAMKGGASGGTLASILNVIDEARGDRSIARLLNDPYALNPADKRSGPDGRDQTNAVFNADAGVWTGPFVMASINTRTVRRTNALLDYPYGRDFRYGEATIAGPGLVGRLKAFVMGLGLKLFVVVAAMPPIRRILLQPFLPKPGEGPAREERESGYFNLLMIGKVDDGQTLRLRIKGDRDPGYGSTSKMLAETALCLAKDEPDVGGGLWTPAAALGDKLLERLVRNAGLTFELE
jgi:short subunit dehydrogenase-like uncharacterized protein